MGSLQVGVDPPHDGFKRLNDDFPFSIQLCDAVPRGEITIGSFNNKSGSKCNFRKRRKHFVYIVAMNRRSAERSCSKSD